jgi:uncharacterized protein
MRFIVIIVLVALSCLPARAQGPGSPEAQVAAKELSAIMSPDMIGQMTDAMTAQVWPKLEGALRVKVDPAVLAEVRAEFEQTLKAFVIDATKDSSAIYARHFSAQELLEMAGFYRTETGAKALRLMPQVMSEYFGTLMPRMEGFNRDLQTRIQAILTKHGVK